MEKIRNLLESESRCFTKKLRRLYPDTVISEGKGIPLRDVKGNSYLDFITMSCVLGHRHPKILQAVRAQLARLDHLYGTEALSMPYLRLAKKLKEICPGSPNEWKVAYAGGGTEAVEFAVKLARCSTGKPVIFSYHGAHHGWGLGTFSFTSDMAESKREYAQGISNVVYIPYPCRYRCAFDQTYPQCDLLCLEHIRQILDTTMPAEAVAGILIEPIQGWSGFAVPPDNYTAKLSRLCKENGLLLIDDEVLVGIGRTGKMLAIDHWAVKPDIILFWQGSRIWVSVGSLGRRQ